MKKILMLLWTLCILTALWGCSGQQAPGFSQDDLVLTIDGEEYRSRDNIESVTAHLGDGYTYAEGRSCNYDGLDKTYTYEQATFYTNPLEEGDLLSEIYSRSQAVSTSKGISVGAEKSAVVAAYGEPFEQDDYLLIYRASEEVGAPALCFELEGGKVSAIFLTVEPV